MVLYFWGNSTAPKSRVEWWKQFLEPVVFIFKWDNHYIILCILQDLKERETGETSVSLTEMTVVNVRLLWFVHGWKKSLYLKRSFHCSEKKSQMHIPPHNRNHSEGATHTCYPWSDVQGGFAELLVEGIAIFCSKRTLCQEGAVSFYCMSSQLCFARDGLSVHQDKERVRGILCQPRGAEPLRSFSRYLSHDCIHSFN